MYLITIIGKDLRCFLTEEVESGGFVIGDVRYTNTGGDWTGFYDFLRTKEGTLVGIRYCPLVDDPLFLKAVSGKPYAKLLPNKTVELYFSNDRVFVPELSGDQEFGENMLLLAPADEYAITFGIDRLSQSEIEQIRNITTGLEQSR